MSVLLLQFCLIAHQVLLGLNAPEETLEETKGAQTERQERPKERGTGVEDKRGSRQARKRCEYG